MQCIDLMNVIEEVTIHRPNVSTLLSSAFIRGDLNAATRENLQIVKFLQCFIRTVSFNVFLHAISPFRRKKIKELNLDMMYSLWVYQTEF